MFILPRVVLATALFSGLCLSAADVSMKVTDSGYLDAQGFSVILYNSTFHPIFVDQKNTAMEMILHGQRIATNGDVRLMPTPEQWDLVAQLKGRQADKENNRLTANLSFPDFQVDYRLEVAAEPGGVRVSINLDKPLPDKLAGRAGFNLEFLPSIFMGKTYSVDGAHFRRVSAQPAGRDAEGSAACRRPEKATLPGGMGRGERLYAAAAVRLWKKRHYVGGRSSVPHPDHFGDWSDCHV